MTECRSCGAQLKAGAKFCPSCGAEVPPPARFCAACGHEIEAGTSFCADCGAAVSEASAGAATTEVHPAPETIPTVEQTASQVTTPMAPLASDVAPPPPPLAPPAATQPSDRSGRFSARLLWLAVAVVVIAIIAAALVFALHGSSHHNQKTNSNFDGSSQVIVTPLVPVVTSVASGLPVSLARCTWSTSLSRATSAAQQLQTTLAGSQSACAALTTDNATQVSAKQALTAALTALGTYAQAVSVLPAQLSAVTSKQAQALHQAATAAQAACQSLHTAAPALPALTVGSCAVIPAGAQKAARDAALRLFLIKVQNDILDQSKNGRSDIVQAVNGVNDMTMNPDDAATMISSVQSNRQSLLDELSAMSVPDDSRASRIFSLLQQSLQHSIEADRYYAAWMNQVYQYYYQVPQGYMGQVPHNANYQSALAQDLLAGQSKHRFCHVYDPIARNLGLRANWQASQI